MIFFAPTLLPAISLPAVPEVRHQAAPLSYPYLGSTVRAADDWHFAVRRESANRADIVGQKGHRTLTMPGIRISEPQNDRITFGPNLVFEPGETNKSYDFHLSPDQQWLFVRRGGMRRFAAGYLYHRIGKSRMAPFTIHGRRLDNAALARYARGKRLQTAVLGGGARNVEFLQWNKNSRWLKFRVYATPYWYNAKREHVPDVEADFTAEFDTHTGAVQVR